MINLTPEVTYPTGAVIQIKKDTDTNKKYIAIKGTPVQPILDALSLSELLLETDLIGMQKLAMQVQAAKMLDQMA